MLHWDKGGMPYEKEDLGSLRTGIQAGYEIRSADL
jgi:hypothetical protein